MEGSPNSSDQDGEDSDKEVEAYADEPLADDEWFTIYVVTKLKSKFLLSWASLIGL